MQHASVNVRNVATRTWPDRLRTRGPDQTRPETRLRSDSVLWSDFLRVGVYVLYFRCMAQTQRARRLFRRAALRMHGFVCYISFFVRVHLLMILLFCAA